MKDAIKNSIRITLQQAANLLITASRGNGIFSVKYEREYPKCEHCGTRYQKGKAPLNCTKTVTEKIGEEIKEQVCNYPISFTTSDTCLCGVQNPGQGITKPGEGTRAGVSFQDALINGCFKYYSFVRDVDRTDGKKGGYRQFRIENLIELTLDKQHYTVIENETKG